MWTSINESKKDIDGEEGGDAVEPVEGRVGHGRATERAAGLLDEPLEDAVLAKDVAAGELDGGGAVVLADQAEVLREGRGVDAAACQGGRGDVPTTWLCVTNVRKTATKRVRQVQA